MIVDRGKPILLKAPTMDFGARSEFYKVTIWVKKNSGRSENILSS